MQPTAQLKGDRNFWALTILSQEQCGKNVEEEKRNVHDCFKFKKGIHPTMV